MQDQDDWNTSINLLSQSSSDWLRLEQSGVVTQQRIRVARKHPDWRRQFQRRTRPLFDPEAFNTIEISKGQYGRIFRYNGHAYKVVHLGVPDDDAKGADPARRLTELRCQLRESIFFHLGPVHPHVCRPLKTELLLTNGRVTGVVHQLPLAPETLETLNRRGSLRTWDQLREVMWQLCLALEHFHRFHVAHGDLKPSNVLWRDKVLLTDFTLTCATTRGGNVSCSSLFWRAPESVLRRPYLLASDMWSVGLIAMDLLYGTTILKDVCDIQSDDDYFSRLSVWLPLSDGMRQHLQVPDRMNHRLMTERRAHIQARFASLRPVVVATEEQLRLFAMWTKQLLQWNPALRATVYDAMRHAVFQGFGPRYLEDQRRVPRVPSLPADDPTATFIIQHIRSYAMEALGRSLMEPDDNVLVVDVLYMVQRLMRTLHERQVTYTSRVLIQHVFYAYTYLFFNTVPPPRMRPQLHAILYHIFTLLNFQLLKLS